MTKGFLSAGTALTLLAGAVPAIAATDDVPGGEAPPQAIAPAQADIIITAPTVQSERDVLSGVTVLKGEVLQRETRATIGETLARQPGVSATSFGPNASRPILRGLQGERIRVLTDGIGAFDVSNTSVDHAVAINPLIADRVEVLRGPAALYYGSQAAGGVVNVLDGRIPRSAPAGGVRAKAIGGFASAASERSGAAAVDYAATSALVLHVDGSYLRSDDIRIGGFALTPQRRREALASAALPPVAGADPIDFARNARIFGTLPNTASETWNVGAGAAYIGNGGSFGLSYSHYASRYGLPLRYATLPGQEQEAPTLDIVQNRIDARAQIDAKGPVIETIRFRAGYARYRHFELEPDGAIGTAFRSAGFEGRLEVVQAKRGAWSGASGVQYFNRDFDVRGAEAFLPRNATSQVGIFTQQQLDLGQFKAEAGARYEWTEVESRAAPGDPDFPSGGRRFGAFSGAVGASYGLSEQVRLGLNLSRTERAPSAEELFARGPHKGTQAFELGNPDFALEKSWTLEATLHAHGERFSIDASAYHSWFSNFITELQVAQQVCEDAAAPSGRDVDLPCFQQVQSGARYYGFEASGSFRVATIGRYTVNVDALGDYVQATLSRLGPAPRIPAGRLLGAAEVQSDRLSARGEVEYVFAQRRIAAFETPTASYTMVNAALSWKPLADRPLTLLVNATNLFDVDARRAASFIKDFAPLPGRDVRLTVRYGL